jgi:hypothetical protein
MIVNWKDTKSTTDAFGPTLSTGERTIRLMLLSGFIAVLAIEAWLLLQAFRIWM